MFIVASSVGTSAYWGLNPHGWIGYVVTVPLWFLGTLEIFITTNLFLMESLGAKAFERFGICTVVMLLYCVLFGVHAAYDLAHQSRSSAPDSVQIANPNDSENPEPTEVLLNVTY